MSFKKVKKNTIKKINNNKILQLKIIKFGTSSIKRHINNWYFSKLCNIKNNYAFFSKLV